MDLTHTTRGQKALLYFMLYSQPNLFSVPRSTSLQLSHPERFACCRYCTVPPALVPSFQLRRAPALAKSPCRCVAGAQRPPFQLELRAPQPNQSSALSEWDRLRAAPPPPRLEPLPPYSGFWVGLWFVFFNDRIFSDGNDNIYRATVFQAAAI